MTLTFADYLTATWSNKPEGRMGLSQELSVEQTLSPALQARMELELRVYARLKAEFDEMKEMLEGQKGRVEGLRAESGEKSLSLAGFKVTLVDDAKSKRLDKKKLLTLGVTQAVIDLATKETTKRAYTLVTLPGEKAEPRRSEEE